MYTTDENAKLLKKLLPQIKATESAIEISLRGQVIKLPMEEVRSQVQARNSKQYR